MHTHETSLKLVTALLNVQSKPAMLAAWAAMVTTSESCIETTIDKTNRVYDRYFAPSK